MYAQLLVDELDHRHESKHIAKLTWVEIQLNKEDVSDAEFDGFLFDKKNVYEKHMPEQARQLVALRIYQDKAEVGIYKSSVHLESVTKLCDAFVDDSV